MTLYIKISNPQESTTLQKYLFTIGYGWVAGGNTVQYTDAKYIVINTKNKQIQFNTEFDDSCSCITYNEYITLEIFMDI